MCDCVACQAAHVAIQAEVIKTKDEVHKIRDTLTIHSEALQEHVNEVHTSLATRDQIRQWDERLHGEIEELAAAVLGPRQSEFAGGGRKEEEGLAWQWNHFTTNGGIPAKLDAKTWAGLIALIITTVGSIAVNLIEHLPPGPIAP